MEKVEKINVLLLDGFDEAGINKLKQDDRLIIDARDESLSSEELKKAIETIHFLGVRSSTRVKKEHLAENLLAIGRAGVGIDNIDVKAASERGVVVFNAPGETANAVAELVIAQMINLSRGLREADISVRSGEWEKKNFIGQEIKGKTLGVIGYGEIGKLVVEYAMSHGMKLIVCEIDERKWGNNSPRVRFIKNIGELYAEADIITLHVPKNEETKNMICEATINQMKPGVIIINTARGGIVNHQDVFKAIKAGRVGGFAADVFPVEGPTPDLIPDLEKVIYTPHIGGQSKKGQAACSLTIAQQFIDFLERGKISNSVNFPTLDPDKELEYPGQHRLIIYHLDVIGALHDITGPLKQKRVNISDQTLRRRKRGGIVYNVFDTDEPVSLEVIFEIEKLPFVIRIRYLDL